MDKILALTDFSENAQQAIDYTLELCKLWQTKELFLLHTYEPPVLYQPDPSGGIAPDGTPALINYTLLTEQAKALEESSNRKISQLREQITAAHPYLNVHALTVEGFLGDAANELIEKEAIALVTMGITGKTGLEKILVGSNAIKAIEDINSPLLIVPDKAGSSVPDKIALASDLELLKDATIAQLEQFMSGLPARDLQIVNINMNTSDPATQEKVSAVKAQLHRLNPVIHFLEAQHIEEGLETFVAQQSVSLLVFVHHERSFFGQLFHKSISKQIAWNTTIPVLRLKG